MRLDEMTTKEVEGLDAGRTVVLVPFAAIEQHGPHLPIGTDTFITEALAAEIERRLPQTVLVIPVQRFGSSPHHMVFAGTVTLVGRTFLDVALELVESLAEHDLRHFLLLNGHGGNQALLDVALQEIRLKMPHVRAVHATYWSIASEAFAAIRESPEGGMGHAGEMETSIMMAIRPDLVRTDLAAPGGGAARCRFDHRDMLSPATVGQFRFWDEWTRNGVLGDPRTASAEKGQRFLAAAAEAAAELARAFLDGKVG